VANVGRAPGRPVRPAKAPDPRTSAGLIAISRASSPIDAVAAAVNHTRATGVPSAVSFDENYARLASDVPRDPRTSRQREADGWIKEHGLEAPHPYLTRKR